MSDAGKRMIEGAAEALAVARGEVPAASIFHAGHRYVPEAELSRLTALVEHLKADRIRISEEAEAEIAKLKVEAGSARMCLNCGKIVSADHPRHEPLPECVGPEGLSACTFDATPQEAWQIWRDRYYALREEAATAKTAGRLEGLEEASTRLDAAQKRHADRFKEDFRVQHGFAADVLQHEASAIRALKEKQP